MYSSAVPPEQNTVISSSSRAPAQRARDDVASSPTTCSASISPPRSGIRISPFSRNACSRASTITRARTIASLSSSRAAGACWPIALQCVPGASHAPSTTGCADVVIVTTTSARSTASRAERRRDDVDPGQTRSRAHRRRPASRVRVAAVAAHVGELAHRGQAAQLRLRVTSGADDAPRCSPPRRARWRAATAPVRRSSTGSAPCRAAVRRARRWRPRTRAATCRRRPDGSASSRSMRP